MAPVAGSSWRLASRALQSRRRRLGSLREGVVLTTDWARDFDLPADTVKGGMCCSGMFDLKPVRLSARRHYINFSDEMEEALSPQRHLGDLNAPLIVAYGTLETPEF